MQTNLIYIISGSIGIIIIYLLYLLTKFLTYKRRLNFITKFSDYASVLELYQGKAYDVIYKDRLLVYSMEATKINDTEFETVSKDFVYLVIKMIGPVLQKEFEDLFGLDALFFNTIEYFNKRYEDDEIRKESVNNLMENDIEDQHEHR